MFAKNTSRLRLWSERGCVREKGEEMLSRTKRLLVRIASNPLRVFGFRPMVGVTLRRLLVGTVAAGLATTLSVGIIAYADDRPLPQGVDAAAKTSDLMLNTLF